jgi:GNAT superfamily N-acetyltransferase
MHIKEAGVEDKDIVLSLLDQFRTEVNKINGSEKVSTTAVEFGSMLFPDVINNNNSAIFLALDDKDGGIGIATINKNPVLRKGKYKAEIEEFFIKPESQGQGIGTSLLKAVEKWSKENDVSYIELISGNELVCAHKFYNKNGFVDYGKGFKKILVE